MSVANQNSRSVYQGNGVATDFGIGFEYSDRSHVNVYVDDARVATTEWSFANDATVRLAVAPADGESVVVAREVPFTQPLEFSTGRGHSPQVVEKALDRLTYLAQQNRDTGGDGGTAPAPSGGVTIAEVLAAIDIDETAAEGLKLTVSRAGGRLRIGLARAAASHAAFVGWSMDRIIAAADFAQAGAHFAVANEGEDGAGVVVPATTPGFVAAYLWFGLARAYPSHVSTDGFRQPAAAFTDEGTLEYNGVEFHIGVSANPLAPRFAGQLVTWGF